MTDSNELLALRLALIGVIFLFVLVTSLVMRASLRSRPRAVAARAPRASTARLRVIGPAQSGLEMGAEFELAGQMTLGRDDDNGIVLVDGSVSGRHAVIEHTGRGWLLRDLGSTNGTLVNGQPVDGRGARLRGGETIALGVVVFRFQP